jgi:hypothetical protein
MTTSSEILGFPTVGPAYSSRTSSLVVGGGVYPNLGGESAPRATKPWNTTIAVSGGVYQGLGGEQTPTARPAESSHTTIIIGGGVYQGPGGEAVPTATPTEPLAAPATQVPIPVNIPIGSSSLPQISPAYEISTTLGNAKAATATAQLPSAETGRRSGGSADAVPFKPINPEGGNMLPPEANLPYWWLVATPASASAAP